MAVSKGVTYRLGPYVPDDEELRDGQGRVIDEGYAEAAVEEALEQVRSRGRPSLSVSGESPLLGVRLPRELDEAVSEAARRAGASRSEWVRRVLDEAAHRAQSGQLSSPNCPVCTGLCGPQVQHLKRIFVLDPVLAWIPAFNPVRRRTQSPGAPGARLPGEARVAWCDHFFPGTVAVGSSMHLREHSRSGSSGSNSSSSGSSGARSTSSTTAASSRSR